MRAIVDAKEFSLALDRVSKVVKRSSRSVTDAAPLPPPTWTPGFPRRFLPRAMT